MDGMIELAIAVGRLENRVSELEKQLKDAKKEPFSAAGPCIATFRSVPVEEKTDEMTADKLIQQGIDNIMGYQWPPAEGRA